MDERKVKRHGLSASRETEKGRLLSGVLALTLANLFVKLLGFVYKVPLNAILGDEMANVNAACTVYALLYTVSTAGIPSAVALTVSRARASGREGRVRPILEGCLVALLSVGLLLSLVLLLLARPLSLFNSGGDSYLCMLAISPALFFSAVSCVFRGFFQGHGSMVPTAVSECLEAMGKAGFGVGLALFCLRTLGGEVRNAAALSVFGITVGVALGALFLALWYLRRGKSLLPPKEASASEGRRAALRIVLMTALPVALSSAMMSLSSFLDAQMMRPLLSSHYGDEGLAKALYSDYSTGALTLYNLPAVLISPIAVAMIPYVAQALERGAVAKARLAAESALRLTAVLSLPAAFGLSALSAPILSFVFRSDADMAENAGPSLSVLAIAVFFAAILTVTTAALQALRAEKRPILSLGVGLAVKLCSMPVAVHFLGTTGVPLSTVFFFAVAAMLNLIFLARMIGIRVRFFSFFLRPLAASVLSAFAALFTYGACRGNMNNGLSLLLAIGAAVLLYLIFLVLFRALDREDVLLLPFGERIASRFNFLFK